MKMPEQISTETPVKEPRMYQKTLDAISIVNAGVEPAKALQLVNNGRKVSGTSVSLFKSKLKKHSLSSPKIVKLAHNAIKDCLEDKAINDEIYPSYTNKLAAASLVYDRYEPAIKQVASLNVNLDCSPVDLSRYANKDVSNNTQDAVFEDAKTQNVDIVD